MARQRLASLRSLPPKESLRPRLAVGVQVRDLGNAHSPVTGSFAQMVIVVGGSVKGATVIPDSKVIDIPPLEAALQVVVLGDGLTEQAKEFLRLLRSDLVDVLGKWSCSIQTLPAGDGVGAYDRVNRRESLSDILGVTPGPFEDGVVVKERPISDEGGG